MNSNPSRNDTPICFGPRLAASGLFDELFRDGMAMVEETATYLDGAGRDEARGLPRLGALAYASESMRLTTRLMQIAAWLLLQRAVNEGEMSPSEAAGDKRRSRGAWEATSLPANAGALPKRLVSLIEKSRTLQERIERLDAVLDAPIAPLDAAHPLEMQRSRLRAAFPG